MWILFCGFLFLQFEWLKKNKLKKFQPVTQQSILHNRQRVMLYLDQLSGTLDRISQYLKYFAIHK